MVTCLLLETFNSKAVGKKKTPRNLTSEKYPTDVPSGR